MSAPSEDVDLVQKHVNQLIEMFDSVQVFCVRHDPANADGTIAVQIGAGNWFSRCGQVREWLVMQDEHSRSKMREQ